MTGYDSRRVSPFGHLRIDACFDSPKLFAVNHVLHRLLTPRHSPCALSSLVTNLWLTSGTLKGLQTPREELQQANLHSLPAKRIGNHYISVAIRRLQGRVRFDP